MQLNSKISLIFLGLMLATLIASSPIGNNIDDIAPRSVGVVGCSGDPASVKGNYIKDEGKDDNGEQSENGKEGQKDEGAETDDQGEKGEERYGQKGEAARKGEQGKGADKGGKGHGEERAGDWKVETEEERRGKHGKGEKKGDEIRHIFF
ncbi:hypothetical protein CF319_g4944 [Tilletia indica]|nr:hypothetical protein CF319_g4944 [Tilletia indica]